MEQAGLQLTFHDLRHAYASLMLAFGYTVLYVSQQLGHSLRRSRWTLMAMSWRKGTGWTGRPRYGSSRKSSAVLRGVLRKAEPADQTNAESLDRTGAGDRTRTDDLRITSAPPDESQE